jgi:hypothetical protein
MDAMVLTATPWENEQALPPTETSVPMVLCTRCGQAVPTVEPVEVTDGAGERAS